MSVGIVLMSRAPIPGKTKTRLQTHLTSEECAKLHKAFLKDISQMLLQVATVREDVNLYLTYTPQGKEELFTDIISTTNFNFFAQQGSNLGEKMYNALNYVAQENEFQIILGSDLPTIQPSIILNTIDKLNKKDIVIGPSQDGGYYLLGTKEPKPFLFDDILWGENEVLRATIKAIKSHSLSYGLVKSACDIDVYPELVELYKQLLNENNWERYPQATKEFVEKLLNELIDKGEDYICLTAL